VLSVVNGQGKYWYETDALGSTYAMTNGAGAVVSRSSYDVFGERALVSANDVAQPFGFTGREHDQGGLVYARNRYLSTVSGQWTQPDPLGQDAGPNYFSYVNDRPTAATDPLGLIAFTLPAARAVAGVAGEAWITAGLRYIDAGVKLDEPLLIETGLGFVGLGIGLEVFAGSCPALTPQGVGLWVEARLAGVLAKGGFVVAHGVRVQTPLGLRVLDVVVFRAGTVGRSLKTALFAIESKFGQFARYTTAQQAKDLWIGATNKLMMFVMKGSL
jgi:RHS repeat-associated protein